MRPLILGFLVSVSTVPCIGQLPEEFTTIAGEYTGYYWRNLSFSEKLAHLSGFQSGYLSAAPSNQSVREQARKSCLAQLANPTPEQNADCLVKSLDVKAEEYKRWESNDPVPGGTYGETVEATDRFFADPENRVMPIVAAWSLTKWKREGRKQSEIDKLMDMERDAYIGSPRKLCEAGWGITASRCATLGTTLKAPPPK
jgi:hypothetical protein